LVPFPLEVKLICWPPAAGLGPTGPWGPCAPWASWVPRAQPHELQISIFYVGGQGDLPSVRPPSARRRAHGAHRPQLLLFGPDTRTLPYPLSPPNHVQFIPTSETAIYEYIGECLNHGVVFLTIHRIEVDFARPRLNIHMYHRIYLGRPNQMYTNEYGWLHGARILNYFVCLRFQL